MLYPTLTAEQQRHLPALLQHGQALPCLFEDSTHQIWRCSTVDGEMMLKVCREESAISSDFWVGLNALFGLQFPTSLGEIELTHQFLEQYGGFKVPTFVAAEAGSFVLAKYIEGEDIDQASVSEADVMALARHICKLHKQTSERWGNLNQPQQQAELWEKQLQDTLRLLIGKNGHVDAALIESVLSQKGLLNEEQFVPLMLDFRWDQCRRSDDGDITLIDLDAFVRGPKELDFVLLEYLLTTEQLRLFASVYQQSHEVPDLRVCRDGYRLLLFLLNVLGEKDLKLWMKQRTFF
jgi:hypothetical protein